MRILVLGSGAREHAIITALLRDGEHSVIAAPGNAGIAQVVETVRVDQNDGDLVARLATDVGAELVVIGPEAPLVAGVADAVRAAGIPVFGPSKRAAQLEGSKAFAKRIMDAAGVPTGAVTRAETVEQAAAALDAVGAPYVVKADGLAAGKGVIVTDDRAAADAHAHYWLQQGPVLVEEFLSGPEVSLFLLSDGTTVRPLAPAQDFKRLRDGDEGPNTGGMGAYSPLPWLETRFGGEQAFVDEVVATIAQPTIDALRAEGAPFVGLLYCGLIVTDAGIKVIEFNARFGDPETQVVLPRLSSPFGAALHAAATGTLDRIPPLEFGGTAAVTVVVASEGYPDDPRTGRPITGIADADALEGVQVMHAATVVSEEHGFVATGGRVLSVVGSGATLAEARERAYAGVEEIRLEGSQARSDIARAAAGA
ncbi:phosphoribosylamine--glycine ligase [Agrococcus sp. SGAir0287]|uniref:phosphoribosylamine--glycine ligase n=1 Tax=Agrococcus sp. SGAir0287 TaxID=2070347 RepID=UPI0010CCBBE2|nr:phosphoribosylamine--glycine ligase [Agrococcus sp. SGAir0287]QCR18347.1 phosphoribosylamine--glycine ligase [Agrococcus sp. SGAir0287]